jgi:hypothetical protein
MDKRQCCAIDWQEHLGRMLSEGIHEVMGQYSRMKQHLFLVEIEPQARNEIASDDAKRKDAQGFTQHAEQQ